MRAIGRDMAELTFYTFLEGDTALGRLMSHCETYCVSSCCGPDAYDVSPARVVDWARRCATVAEVDAAREQLNAALAALAAAPDRFYFMDADYDREEVRQFLLSFADAMRAIDPNEIATLPPPFNASYVFRRFDDATDSIEALTELLHRAYASHAAAGRRFYASYQTPQETRERIRGSECWIATANDGSIAGTVTLVAPHRAPPDFPAPKHAGIFHQLAVLPEHQHHGLGNQLRDLAEKRIAQLGFDAVVIDTSTLATELLAWYERHGYERVGTWQWDTTNYQSVVMVKTLQSPIAKQ